LPVSSSGSTFEYAVDTSTAVDGAQSLRITSTTSVTGQYGFEQQGMGAYLAIGKTLHLSGAIRTQGMNGSACLWASTWDAQNNNLTNQDACATADTAGWQSYSLSVYVPAGAASFTFGVILSGTGTAWFDNLQIDVNGLNLYPDDHEFDNGSEISIGSLSDVQIQNLATLAKVWGFLKYYHPAVTNGQHQWDYDLFRVIPAVLAAADGPAASQAISSWIAARLPALAPCNPCATLYTADLYMRPDIAWIFDTSLLSTGLSQTLQSVYANRSASGQSFFVSLTSGVGNPVFQNESQYATISLPDSGYQLLALFRAWNMVEYFYPNRDVMSDDPAKPPNYWNDVLKQFIAGFAQAGSSLAYQQQLLLFTTKINDTHSGFPNFSQARPPVGACQLPVQIRFAEGVPVVVGYLSPSAGPATGLQVGDVIQQLDGVGVSDLVAQWTPYYTDSNQGARLHYIGNAMTQGACGPASVSILRGQQQLSLTASRMATYQLDLTLNGVADRPGDTFQLFPGNIAYLKLSSVVAAQSAAYIQQAAGTRGLIIDIRNYPHDFVVFTLGDLLASAPVAFVKFTAGDVTTPGAFHLPPAPVMLTPAQPHYPGPVVVLVNEISLSNAEYTSLAFRAAGATIVGSTTAGADGNISTVPLPGGFTFSISGIGVFYPDNRPTQRVGIVPDVVVTPTIAGITAGVDEVLQTAIGVINLTAPAAPVPVSPSNGAGGVALSPVLTWTASTGATSYDLYFGASSTPPLVTNTTAARYSAGSLALGSTYYWRVVAKNGSGSVSSATWSFSTQLSVPLLSSPADGASGASVSPSLTWGAVAGATSYDVYFGTLPAPPLVTHTTATSYAPGPLNSWTIYYWQIAARNPADATSSAIRSFTTGAPAGSLRFVPVAPCRVADTRGPAGAFGRPRLAADSRRDFPIPQSGCKIPATAQAYSLNVTVVPEGYLGYLSLWPAGQPQPGVSTLNSWQGHVVANAAIVPAGTGGAVSVYVSDPADVVLDINGYFDTSTGPASWAFYPATPCRVADTRLPAGEFAGPSMYAGQTRDFPISLGACGIPATARAYALNVTVVPAGYLGYLSAWPTGLAAPNVSTLNSWTGQVVANAAIVPGGTNESISLYASDATDAIVDVNGYFGLPAGAGALSFYPVTPCRVADTRRDEGLLGGPIMGAGESRPFAIPASGCGIPSTAAAYSLNVTVVPEGYLGYLSAWPAGQTKPGVSTLNSWDGGVVANAAIVPAGANGAVGVYVTDRTHVILDINGYFAP
jgi:C-terminal processing protease CtpA/Prc